MIEPVGTFECWICGNDTPHYHPPSEVDLARRWHFQNVGKLKLRYTSTMTLGPDQFLGQWAFIVGPVQDGTGRFMVQFPTRTHSLLILPECFDWTNPQVIVKADSTEGAKSDGV